MINYSCPKCGDRLRVADEQAGKAFVCGLCGSSSIVPASPPEQSTTIVRSQRALPWWQDHKNPWSYIVGAVIGLCIAAPLFVSRPKSNPGIGVAAFVAQATPEGYRRQPIDQCAFEVILPDSAADRSVDQLLRLAGREAERYFAACPDVDLVGVSLCYVDGNTCIYDRWHRRVNPTVGEVASSMPDQLSLYPGQDPFTVARSSRRPGPVIMGSSEG